MSGITPRVIIAGLLRFIYARRPSRAPHLQRGARTQAAVDGSPSSSGGTLQADYGDHASAAVTTVPGGFFTYGAARESFTPDVSVDVFSAAANATDPRVRLWQTGYGDLVRHLRGWTRNGTAVQLIRRRMGRGSIPAMPINYRSRQRGYQAVR